MEGGLNKKIKSLFVPLQHPQAVENLGDTVHCTTVLDIFITGMFGCYVLDWFWGDTSNWKQQRQDIQSKLKSLLDA